MERKATETDKFLGLTRPLFPRLGVSETPPAFLSKSGFNVEASDDITPLSCPRPIRTVVGWVHNASAKQKLCKGFTKKSADHQRRPETPKFLQRNVEELQVSPAEPHRPLAVETPVDSTRPTTAGTFREQQDICFSETRFSHMTVTPRQLFKKKEKSERGQSKTLSSYQRRTQTPQINGDHFREWQEFSFLETHLPPLVDTPVNVAQQTPNGTFTERQEISFSETRRSPLAVTPSQLFKQQEMSKRGPNKTTLGSHRKTDKPQIFPNNVKEQQQDLGFSKSQLPPLAPLVDSLVSLAQQTTKHNVKEQRERSCFHTHLSPLTVTPCKLFRRKEMSKKGGNKTPVDHQRKTDVPQSSANHVKKQQDARSSETHFPPLVDSLFTLAQHTTKRIFRKQDTSFFETHRLPFTVTPCKLFKRKEMLRRGGNKIPVGLHRRTKQPTTSWNNVQEQQDGSWFETHHPPSTGANERTKYDIH